MQHMQHSSPTAAPDSAVHDRRTGSLAPVRKFVDLTKMHQIRVSVQVSQIYLHMGRRMDAQNCHGIPPERRCVPTTIAMVSDTEQCEISRAHRSPIICPVFRAQDHAAADNEAPQRTAGNLRTILRPENRESLRPYSFTNTDEVKGVTERISC